MDDCFLVGSVYTSSFLDGMVWIVKHCVTLGQICNHSDLRPHQAGLFMRIPSFILR